MAGAAHAWEQSTKAAQIQALGGVHPLTTTQGPRFGVVETQTVLKKDVGGGRVDHPDAKAPQVWSLVG